MFPDNKLIKCRQRKMLGVEGIKVARRGEFSKRPIISLNSEAGGRLGEGEGLVGTQLALAKQIVSRQTGKYTEVDVGLAEPLTQIL